MTPELKSRIMKRQRTFHHHGADSIQFKFYRNALNRTRKRGKAQFYESKVQHLKRNDPKRRWSEVKRLCGINSSSGGLRDHIDIEELNNLPLNDLANAINNALLEPLDDYRLPNPLAPLPLEDDSTEFLDVTEHRVYKVLVAKISCIYPSRVPNYVRHAKLFNFPIFSHPYTFTFIYIYLPPFIKIYHHPY